MFDSLRNNIFHPSVRGLLLMVYTVVPFLFGGCVSLVEKAGRAVDGSAFAEKTISVYKTEKNTGTSMEIREMRNKAGERSIIIMPGEYPAIKFRGSVPDDEGEFQLTSLDYLGGSPNGWNEYSLDILGSGNLRLGETTALFSINPDIYTVQISSGRIRRFDTRITGTEALTSLGNRRERIVAIAEWMNGYVPETNSNKSVPAGDLTNFEKHWMPILFPELVPRIYQPAGWRQPDDQWVKAEDIRWNTSYTERIFPELLREIRNSGTMLRDWEEALNWLHIEYEWDRITEMLSKEIVLNRVK